MQPAAEAGNQIEQITINCGMHMQIWRVAAAPRRIVYAVNFARDCELL